MISAEAIARPKAAAWAVHATAVAIQGRALLIRGPSKVGKSRLALALIAASTPRRPIILIGDDRIILTPEGDGLTASPHPRIAGFIERRGLGILAVPFQRAAGLDGVFDLVPAAASPQATTLATVAPEIVLAGLNFPLLSIVVPGAIDPSGASNLARSRLVLDWFVRRDKRTTHPSESET